MIDDDITINLLIFTFIIGFLSSIGSYYYKGLHKKKVAQAVTDPVEEKTEKTFITDLEELVKDEVKEKLAEGEEPKKEEYKPEYELDAEEVTRLARMASKKLNRERLFSLARVIRSDFGLEIQKNPIEKDDKVIIDDFNKEMSHLNVPETEKGKNKPKKVDVLVKEDKVIRQLTKYEVLSLGNKEISNTTARAPMGKERPQQIIHDPVVVGVPLETDAEQVTVQFHERGFDLMAIDKLGKRRRLKINDLEQEIIPEKCTWKMKKKNKAILTMVKKHPDETWHNLRGQITRTTADFIKKAEKVAERDPALAIQQVIENFCGNLPQHGTEEEEQVTANDLQARLMMGMNEALEKTYDHIQSIERGEIPRPVFSK